MEITQGIRKMVIPLPHLPISPSPRPVRPVRPVRLDRLEHQHQSQVSRMCFKSILAHL
ncbi:MAG: hypothetical protein F6K31_04830 [Symploca sp. SIO2G7]|nr:hypothetical protein [Symploca sp. SIO2G7]